MLTPQAPSLLTFPLTKFSLSLSLSSQEGGNRVLTLSQRKFCGDGNITGQENLINQFDQTSTSCVCLIGFESMLWKVPIVIATKGNPQAASLVLTEQSTTVTLEGVGEGDWVLVNKGHLSVQT